MTYATLRREDIIASILNWVCPECGGPMGGQRKEFECQGRCQRDWRQTWENQRVAKGGNNKASPHVVGKQYKAVPGTESISDRTADLGGSLKATPTSQAIMANARHSVFVDALPPADIPAHR